MIARIWRGTTREADKDTYFEYLQKTGLKEYASIRRQPGRVGLAASGRRKIRVHPDLAVGFMGRHQSLRWPGLRRTPCSIRKMKSSWWNEVHKSSTTKCWQPRRAKPVWRGHSCPRTDRAYSGRLSRTSQRMLIRHSPTLYGKWPSFDHAVRLFP